MREKLVSLPDGNDVREKKKKTEEISVPRSSETFEANHHERQTDYSNKQQLKGKYTI